MTSCLHSSIMKWQSTSMCLKYSWKMGFLYCKWHQYYLHRERLGVLQESQGLIINHKARESPNKPETWHCIQPRQRTWRPYHVFYISMILSYHQETYTIRSQTCVHPNNQPNLYTIWIICPFSFREQPTNKVTHIFLACWVHIPVFSV